VQLTIDVPTVLYFALSGLDVLNALDQITDQKRQSIIDWVYAQQVLPSADSIQHCGFRGSPFVGCTHCDSGSASSHPLDSAHIAMTYTALCILRILNDDMRRVRRAEIVQSLRFLQEPDGSFKSVLNGSEKDMRFIFCAYVVGSFHFIF
jgi:geranylgeranyl transferase type-1 subunit beta